MTRQYSPAAKAKRDKKFLENLARKENPIRSLMALPSDVKLEQVSWSPDHLEQIAERLAGMKIRWAREDAERRQQRLKEVLAAVEADRKAGLL
jgi:hypothetical protein